MEKVEEQVERSASIMEKIGGLLAKWWQLSIALIILVIAVIMIFNKNNAIKDLEELRANREVEFQIEKRQLILAQNNNMLELVTVPLVWAVRSELLRGNEEQLETYLRQMVRLDNFELICVSNETGAILVSTNKKLEGDLISDHFEINESQSDNIQVELLDSTTFRITAPVMGFSNRIGGLYAEFVVPDTLSDSPPVKVSDESDDSE